MLRYSALLSLCFLLWAPGVQYAQQSSASPIKQLKFQQKIERKRLKAQQKIWKKSFHGQPIPRAERIQMKHQYQRNMRDLKEHQKDQIQEMKDQQRIMKERALIGRRDVSMNGSPAASGPGEATSRQPEYVECGSQVGLRKRCTSRA